MIVWSDGNVGSIRSRAWQMRQIDDRWSLAAYEQTLLRELLLTEALSRMVTLFDHILEIIKNLIEIFASKISG